MNAQTIKAVKNTGNGNNVALQIPSGMTGRQLQKWLDKNKPALQAAKNAINQGQTSEVVFSYSEETTEEKKESD